MSLAPLNICRPFDKLRREPRRCREENPNYPPLQKLLAGDWQAINAIKISQNPTLDFL
jgi:hypothetical protein